MSPFSLLNAFLTLVVGMSLVSAAYPNPGTVAGDTYVHDPAIVKVGGTYYLYATAPGISIKTSTDRINFKDAGVAFPSGLSWCDSYTEEDRNIWAPEVRYVNNQFYLWYACSSFGSQTSAIFLATSKTGLSGSWTNKGKVYASKPENFVVNAIDPGVLIDGGKWYMTLGSFGTGIYQLELDPNTGLALNTNLNHVADRTTGDHSEEGATIFKKGGYYYLFLSFDRCCNGASSTYRIMVGRSTSPTGPFVDKAGTPLLQAGGTEILAGHGSIHGPGAPFILTDVDGDLLVYHYYASNGDALLGINLLNWTNGWPTVI
ncbi:hypothetical protein ACQY0O_001881 [Thecaphora frezii]